MADNETEKNGNGSNGQSTPVGSPAAAPSPDEGPATEPDEQPADADEEAVASDEGGEPSAETEDDEPAEVEEVPAEPTLEEELEAARKQVAATKERMLRLAADFDNFRKRASRDVEATRLRGKQSAIRELLPVFDNLERAAGQDPDGVDAKSIADGVRIVLKMFVDTLGKLGIERIDALGKAFDPMLHEGIQHDFSDEFDAGSVMAVFHSGYKMGKDLLRPALVVVSRGAKPAEPPAEPPAAEQAEADEAGPDGDDGDSAGAGAEAEQGDEPAAEQAPTDEGEPGEGDDGAEAAESDAPDE
ncbi:MAG: nucleotide exchange factor GrpE [Deltaproteobacteria bacterium]|nr:nucleotide exchange factor GrpE [Deltaproteobacteria bacterium]